MGRKSNAQIEMEKKMAEATQEVVEDNGTSVMDPIADPTPTETEQEPIVGQKRQFSYTPPMDTSIREMRLSPEQKDMIIRAELSDILDVGNTRQMDGGFIPVFVDYPLSDDAFEVATAFIRKDYRLVQSAWDYYKQNADNPTVRKFVNLVSEILGLDEKFRRVHHLRLN